MAQILIKGESVYRCDVCNRKIRVLTSRTGIDVVQRCTITYGCRGRLHQLRDAKEINSTPAFPTEVPGVQDWFQRKVLYSHNQPIKTKTWTIKHGLSNKPLLYVYTSRQTSTDVVPPGTIYVGTVGSNIHEILEPAVVGNIDGTVRQDVVTFSINTIDANTTEINFEKPQSGMVQCVALASQNTANPIPETIVDGSAAFKLSNNGEITIATASENPFISVLINFKSATIRAGVNATFNNVDNTASVASPWVNVGKIYVNGKTYNVRSFNLANTAPVPGIMATGNVDVAKARFTFENLGSKANENIILLGSPPYLTVDRIYNQVVDIALIDKFSPELYYSDGEIYVEQSAIKTVYPLIHTVD